MSSLTTLPERKTLPDVHRSINHTFDMNGRGWHLIVGLYENGRPGRISLKSAYGEADQRELDLMEQFSEAASILLQQGIPLSELTASFKSKETSMTGEPIPPDVLDYVFRYLEKRFPD